MMIAKEGGAKVQSKGARMMGKFLDLDSGDGTDVAEILSGASAPKRPPPPSGK